MLGCEIFSFLQFQVIDLFTIRTSFRPEINSWLESNSISELELMNMIESIELVQLSMSPEQNQESYYLYSGEIEEINIPFQSIGINPASWSADLTTELPNTLNRNVEVQFYFRATSNLNQSDCPNLNFTLFASRQKNLGCDELSHKVSSCYPNININITNEPGSTMFFILRDQNGNRIAAQSGQENIDFSIAVDAPGTYDLTIVSAGGLLGICLPLIVEFIDVFPFEDQVNLIPDPVTNLITVDQLNNLTPCSESFDDLADCIVIRYTDENGQEQSICISCDGISVDDFTIPEGATDITIEATGSGNNILTVPGILQSPTDNDGDGEPNASDLDINNNGIPNSAETGDDQDLDGDGILNEDDSDIDNDGILNENDDTPNGPIPEDCTNGIDDDGDGFDDCIEIDCILANANRLTRNNLKSTTIDCEIFSSELISYLSELNTLDIVDPCNPSTKERILNTAIQECIPFCTVDKLKEVLTDRGVIIQDFDFNVCPEVPCVFNEIFRNGNSEVCDMLSRLTDESSRITLNFIANGLHIDGGGNASTSPVEDGIIEIAFAQAYCADHQVSQTATLLHEIIHAHMYQEVYENGGDQFDPNDYASLFNYALTIPWKYGKTGSGNAQHEIMAADFIFAIVEGLQEIYGTARPIEAYVALAWEGLEQVGIDLDSYDGQSLAYYRTFLPNLFNSIPHSCIGN
jgi:hypothetical protein